MSDTVTLPPGPGAMAAVLEPALVAAAGADGRRVAFVSLALDYAAPAEAGAELAVRAWLDRATRSLVFASAEAALPDGRIAAAAQAVFKVVG